jgi:mono/diheme cytochrome c family protein
MRRTALVFVLLVAALSLVAAGCGGEEEQSATPETVTGEITPPETETTTETESTGTETTGAETTETTATETTPAAPKGDPVAGKEIFLGPSGCTGCHTLADAGSSGNVGPNLDEAQPSFDLAYDRVTNGTPSGMPPFEMSLSDQQRADVAAYVSSVAGQ